jgi:predicted SnoaL-like aldol condensation-catalyzing enzyme
MSSRETDTRFREPTPNRDIALRFLKQVIAGRISEAFEWYVAREGFRHHNPYFRGDRESLKAAMMEANRSFPKSTLEVQRVLEAPDDDTVVAIHSRVKHSAESPEIAVVHIFRIEREKIVELWDIGVQMPKDSPNENGLF